MLYGKWPSVIAGSIVTLTVVIVSFAAQSPTFAYSKEAISEIDFEDFPPILLRTEDGKQYKFDIDVLQDAGHTTGEPSTVVNHQASGDTVRLKKGEQIMLTYGSPYGFSDYIQGSLLKGRVVTDERLNDKVKSFGIQTVFLRGGAPPEGVQAQIPPGLRIGGTYDLVILITFNEEVRGYYITNAIVS